MDKRIIRLAEAKNLSGLSRSSIYALMNEGMFPQKVSIGSRAIGWCSASTILSSSATIILSS